MLYDADNGLGHPVGKLAMEKVIEKARKHGSAFGAVRNSNHFGIAGYYAMLALDARHDRHGVDQFGEVRRADVRQGRDARHQSPGVRHPGGQGARVRARLCDDDRAEGQTRSLQAQEPSARRRLGDRRERRLDDRSRMRRCAARCCRSADSAPTAAVTRATASGCSSTFSAACSRAARSVRSLPIVTETKDGAISHWFGAFRVDAFRDVAQFKADMDSRTALLQRQPPGAGPGPHLRCRRDRVRKDARATGERRSGAHESVGRIAEARGRAGNSVRSGR